MLSLEGILEAVEGAIKPQAVVAMNPDFEDRDRRRWRIMIACMPGSMAVYWHRHIRVN